MKKPPFERKFNYSVTMSAVTLIIGFLVGLLVHTGIHAENKITGDGMVTGIAALVAVVAATYLLPLKIQPLLHKHSGSLSVAKDDINALLSLITEVIETCEQLNLSNKRITLADRKLVLARHKQIHNLASILKQHAAEFPAMADFDEKVSQPLNDSRSDFADNVLPNHRMTDTLFLAVRGKLDPITIELRNIRYDLN